MSNPIRPIHRRAITHIPPVVFNPIMDVDEKSGKQMAKIGAFLTKLVSRKKQAKAFGAVRQLADFKQGAREKVLKSSELSQHEETMQLNKSMDQESAQRLKQEEEVLSASRTVQLIAIKKILKKTEGDSNKAIKYLNTGFEIAYNIIHSGQAMEVFLSGFDIRKSPEFEVAWNNVQEKMEIAYASKTLIESVKEEFTYFVNLSMQCVRLDIEVEQLAILKTKISEKKEQINSARDTEKHDLKRELNQLKLQERELKKSIDSMQGQLPLGRLQMLVFKGSTYSEAITTLMKTGSHAHAVLSKMTKQLGLLASLFNFTTTVGRLIEHGKEMFKLDKKIATLEGQQKISEPNSQLNPLTRLLIDKMHSFKLMHLKKSKMRLKTEAAFTMLRALIASVKLTKVSVACLAILCGVVIATPGLNTAAAAATLLGMLVIVGVKGIEFGHKLKHKGEGLRLELQKNEESSKIFALSGKFHTKTSRFQQLQVEMSEVAREEADIHSLVKELYEKRDAYSNEQFEAIEIYLAMQLNPIANRRKRLQNKYDVIHNELYMMSLELDAMIAKKQSVQAHRGIETLSQEFNAQKSDLLEMADVFRTTLESKEVKREFMRFLTERGIAITSEKDIFASVLRFIRTDAEMEEEHSPH